MSNPSPLPNESVAPSSPEAETQPELRHRLVRSIKGPMQFLSFWVAIALPFIYFPLLTQGLGDPTVTLTFFVLLLVNVFALYLGHGYNRS